MKKALSLILVLVMLLGMMPMQVFATEGTQETEAVEVVTEPAVAPEVIHEHDYEAVVTDPTCTEKGYTTQYMERPATGCHNFSVNVNIAPAMGEPDRIIIGTDYGYIQLPTSYTSYGEPTRLIIACHGAGATLSNYQSNTWKNTNYYYWTDFGYAVMDMYACPVELGDGSASHYGNPVVLECYKKGYEYVLEHFNLKQDGIFLIGASMGGLSSFQIAQSGHFPVIAQVGFCPVTDLFKQAYCNPWTTASYQRSRITSYFGFIGTQPTFTNGKYPSAAEIEFYRQNLDKTVAYSPILRNVVDGDVASIFGVIPNSATAASVEEAAIYAQLTATHPNPLLIFHNTDDSAVAYRYSQYFVDMVNRSGQEAKLYTFTSGAHNAWANGVSVTVQGINGQITIKESQYEAYKFFEKFEKHEVHQPWVDPAVKATCSTTGLTEGKHCASCGEILVNQNVIPTTNEHTYENGICTGCGEKLSFKGKTISILGDSISTYTGVSNDSSVNVTLKGGAIYYNAGTQGVYRADTWWQQTIDALGMELLVNNSWSGSTVLHTRSGTAGAYVDRCVQLHNTAGDEPDVIVVFLGTNDFSYYQSALGTANIDYSKLITDNGDGTYTYATPKTTCEAYAVMLHKMVNRYPDAEVYCMNLLPRRNPDHDGKDVVPAPTQFNGELAKVISHFGCTVVDLENCGITPAPENFDIYITDQRVHPGLLGMDKMTQALIDTLMGKEDATFAVSQNLENVTANVSGGIVLAGGSFNVALTPAAGFDELTVTVTMGGKDVTASVYSDGKVNIPAVTGDVLITASAAVDDIPKNYYWEISGNSFVNVAKNGLSANALTKKAGSITDGVIKSAYFQLENPVVLRHNLPWIVEWRVSGTSWTGMLLSGNANASAAGNSYLFKTIQNTGFIGFGEAVSGSHHNYGIALASQGIDLAAEHTYQVENRIAADGSNMVYLLVDGKDYGPMNHYYIGGNSNQDKQVDWLNGRDFCFFYIGANGHPLNNCQLDYLSVTECNHTYENGICTGCGEKEFSNSHQTENFRWEISNGKLTSITDANFSSNAATALGGSITNGVISSGRYQFAKPLSLLHDQPWAVEWRGSGDWTGMLLATTPDAYDAGLPYFFKTGTNSGLVAFGYKDTQVNNYGRSLKPLGLDYTQSHTYRMENRIHQDGSNMVYLLVDNVEIGPMNCFYIGGSNDQNQTVDWLSGKDFSMSALGTTSHPINGIELEYLHVMVGGHSHSYEAVATAPTCTEQGYTTYTCNCGASYVDDYVEAVWHSNENGNCSMCGCAMARITRDDITPSVGTVSSLDGTVNTTITTGWYWDIPIPEGAKQIRYMTFKTAASWGSAFLNGSTYISGVCDTIEGYKWVTMDIPEGTTIFRHGYLSDARAEQNGRPQFQYVEFSNAKQDISQYMPRPATGCHSFSVNVNIAPAMGDPDGNIVGTDYGYIMLPTNYTSYGEPTRLIIVCHGAGGKRSTYQSSSWKIDQNTFWTDMGYAIMDMAACPKPLTTDDRAIHYGNPTVVDCYKAGFDYVMENFNLKQDGIYVIGTSMGGLSSFQIVQSGKFPVLAQVGFCPAIDLFKQAYCAKWGSAERDYQKSHISSYFGFEGAPASFTNTFPTDAEIELYKNNFEKTVKYSPILCNVVDGDITSIFNAIPTSATGIDATEAAIYAQLTATHPCPVMIIHSKDDSVVSYRYSQYFVDMLKRSGQAASLYTIDGVNHMAWQYGKNCTLQGLNGQITIKESQYEAYKFFEKFEKHEEHQPWVDPAVKATCSTTGLTEGKHCASCGEILVNQNVIPTTNEHTYENGICTICGANTLEYTVTASLDGNVLTLAGEIAEGTRILAACYDGDGRFVGVRILIWQGSPIVEEIPSGEIVRLFFVDENCSPLRKFIPLR